MTVVNKQENWMGNCFYQIKDAAGSLFENGQWVEEKALSKR